MKDTELLDKIDDYIYVSDIYSYEMLFINKKIRESTGINYDYKGRKCFEILQGRTSPCPFCTNHILSEDKYYIWQHFNQYFGSQFILKDKLIEWDGKLVRFELALDITDGIMPTMPKNILKANKLITQQKEQLQCQANYLRELYDSLPCGVAQFTIEEPRRLIEYNDACLKIFGYSSRKNFNKATESDIDSVVHKEDRKFFRNIVERVVRSGEREEYELRIIREDGSIGRASKVMEIVQSPTGQTVIRDVFLDITEEREKEIKINALAEKLPIALGIFEVTDRIRLTYISEGWYKITGYSAEEYKSMLDKEITTAIYPEDAPSFLMRMQKAIRSRTGTAIEIRFIRKDGSVLWVSIKSKLVSEETDKLIYYAVYSDIDQLKKSEIEAETQRAKYEKEAEQNKKQYEREVQYIKGISKDVLATAKVNLTQNRVELYRANNDVEYNNINEHMPYDVVLNKIAVTVVNSDERKNMLENFDRVRLLEEFNNGILAAEVDCRRRDMSGAFIWVRTHIKLMREPKTEDIIGFIVERDIDKDMVKLFTSRKLLEHMQVVSNEKYYFVVALDYAGNSYDIIQCNQRNHREIALCGRIDEFVSKMYLFYDEKYYDFLDILKDEKLLAAQFCRDKREWIYEGEARNGEVINWYEHLVIPVVGKDTNEVIYLFATTIINERKRKEDELKKALQGAEKAGKAKQEFLSHMSHEIRTPLNGIRGMLDLMKEQGEYIDIKLLNNAIASAKHLSSLINDILDMSKIESGKISLQRNAVFLEELTDSLMAIMKLLADEKGITLTCNIIEPLYPAFYADEKRLKQILINILSNAIKYTNIGGWIRFDILTERVKETVIIVKFIIEDNGIGIDKEFLESIFEPFEQGKPSFDRAGTGLGLAITKELVELMDGDIKIESEVGCGTKITISLQTDGTGGDGMSADDFLLHGHSSHYKNMDFHGKKALVVEDNEINMQIAKMQLEYIGLKVDTAYNGEQAVAKVQESAVGFYDIIFMDVMMPIKDGLAATKEIRQLVREDAAKIPIVAMTANVFSEDIHKSLESGMNYHLSKPFDKINILEILAQEFYGRNRF